MLDRVYMIVNGRYLLLCRHARGCMRAGVCVRVYARGCICRCMRACTNCRINMVLSLVSPSCDALAVPQSLRAAGGNICEMHCAMPWDIIMLPTSAWSILGAETISIPKGSRE